LTSEMRERPKITKSSIWIRSCLPLWWYHALIMFLTWVYVHASYADWRARMPWCDSHYTCIAYRAASLSANCIHMLCLIVWYAHTPIAKRTWLRTDR
jgi:hypothetical protein